MNWLRLKLALVFSFAFAFVMCCAPVPAFSAPADLVPWTSAVTGWLASPPAVVTMLAGVGWDLVRRFWPTDKASGLLHDIGSVFVKIGSMLVAMGEFTDKIIPQNSASAPAGLVVLSDPPGPALAPPAAPPKV